MSFRTKSRIEEFILHSTWQQGKWLAEGCGSAFVGFPSGHQLKKQVCSAAYLLVISRLLVLLGGLNLFTEERLGYFCMSLFLLCSSCVTDKWETQYSLRYEAAGEKKLLQAWLEQFFQILPESERMKSVF